MENSPLYLKGENIKSKLRKKLNLKEGQTGGCTHKGILPVAKDVYYNQAFWNWGGFRDPLGQW